MFDPQGGALGVTPVSRYGLGVRCSATSHRLKLNPGLALRGLAGR
jgi:hypothetical protein